MGELVDHVDEQDQVLGVVDRAEAIRQGWLHRIATIVCRDEEGRFLVHRRPDDSSRFPGRYNWMLGGAAAVGESYEKAAARELSEELGVHAAPRFVLTFLCAGEISPYWLGLHEAVITSPVRPRAEEVAWHGWLTETELESLVRQQDFIPDAREAFDRYRDLSRAERASTSG
ncbi:NUDIX domain-containing protein [Streptomyces sp. MB09-01]|uniref:NUDIX hydrolase n=1 Tax=Streptomyces sp. MB09-01 TaxID=3028666 RepID=UPI0029A3F26A|nr:NUDIX domain-containing protein [Streptomyces sp. MB09-01]MDX3540545.1 NUDIX domain-containing protein [Streptomyces sp. MB09-01]